MFAQNEEPETAGMDVSSMPVTRALDKVHGGMKASDIDQVLLVGGSSRIPKVQQILQEMFPQTELCRRINPDEAIAVGAAMDASHAYKVEPPSIPQSRSPKLERF